jgi:hypothetical protein
LQENNQEDGLLDFSHISKTFVCTTDVKYNSNLPPWGVFWTNKKENNFSKSMKKFPFYLMSMVAKLFNFSSLMTLDTKKIHFFFDIFHHK